MKNIKKNTNINLTLNDIDLSEINALINILNNAISLNNTKILIIFNDITINYKIWSKVRIGNGLKIIIFGFSKLCFCVI